MLNELIDKELGKIEQHLSVLKTALGGEYWIVENLGGLINSIEQLIAQAEQKAVGNINHKAMCKDIYDLVTRGDEVFNLTDCHLATSDPKGYTEWTQEEAKRMAEILGRVYSIVHGYESGCCAGKYELRKLQGLAEDKIGGETGK